MTKLRSVFLTLFLLTCWLAVRASQAQAAPHLDGTEHTGTLIVSETWTPAGNPHYVNGSITIPAGITLTLESGVIVGSYNNYYTDQTGRIVVQGVLNAVGTSDNKIIFTSRDDSAPTQWDSLNVDGGTAHLAYAEVRYGGGGGGCRNSYYSPLCVEHAGTLLIDHVYFHDNSPLDNTIFGGVVTAFSGSDTEQINLSITNSLFEENGTSNSAAGYYPIFLDGPGIQLTMSGNTFANNQVNRILLQNNPMKTQVALTLPAQTGLEAYELNRDWTVPVTQTLTLNPGVTLIARHGDWGRGVALVVEGKLLAQGSEAHKITLDATDPAYGWSGLVMRGAGGLAQLAYTQFLHGGTPGLANSHQSNLVVENGARLELSDSRVADLVTAAANYSDGALMVVNGTAVLTGNTIADNLPTGATAGLYAMRVSGPQSRLKMVNNTFSGNFINAVLLGSDGLAATLNTLRPQPGLLGYDIGVPNSDYTYILQPAGQLTLEAGTRMRGVYGPWGKGVYLEVQGKLHASGTADAPVVFEAADGSSPASWGGIYVNGGTADLFQTRIENAGRGQGYLPAGPFPSLWVNEGGTLTVNNALISNNKNLNGADTTVKVENASASIRNSIFTGNGNPGESDYPISISGAASQVTLAGNQFDVNGYKRVLLLDNAMTGTDFFLPMVDGLEGYELASKFTVPAGITLTVQPGVKIFGRSGGVGSGLMVNGGLVAQATPGKEIVFTSSTDDGPSQWAGVIFSGPDAHGMLDGVSLRCGGESLPPYNDPTGSLIFSNLALNAVQVLHSQISSSGTAGWQIFNSNITQNDILDGNRLISNPGDGLRISGTSQVVLANTAVVNNTGYGIFLAQSGVHATLLQTTLAGSYTGVRTLSDSTATMINTILYKNSVGVEAKVGSTVTLNSTLWDANTTATSGDGSVVNNTPYSGSAAFDPADGYHLSLYSQALGKGQDAGISTDIDGSSRPQPAGSLPDLGADEFNQAAATEMTAEKLAIPPVWINMPDPGGNPLGELVQKYWIRFLYGSNDAAEQPVNVSVEDNLPAGLNFESETHTPAMSFIHTGQTLQWLTEQTVSPRQTLDIQIDTRNSDPVAGSTYNNGAILNAGGANFFLSAETQVPVFTPLITWPARGELCALPSHTFSVEGSAQPGATIEIYEGSILKGQSVTNAQGLFKVSYTGSQAGQAALNLRARACAGATCSDFTQVSLTQSQSFWDPQRSWWEGDPLIGPMAGKHVTFKFRDQDGLASSSNWIIPGISGFHDTTLHLYACEDPATGKMPTQIWITADAQVYVPVSFSGNMYTYKIGGAHHVLFQSTYQPDPPPTPPDPDDPPLPYYPPDPDPTPGDVLFDPDGYVFNSTLGFDPQNPTQHVIPGAQVTCMAYLPGWGGWVPWPAHLYENQVNPQVVGSNGYFAFFTPPGQFYLQVDGPAGYQSWRSPVVTVVNEIVHVNIPLTPIIGSSSYILQSSRAGLSKTELTIPVGGKVRWNIIQSIQEDSISLLADAANPIIHLVSSPDPFASTEGWDSGRLYPGQSYTHQFNNIGVYTYTDSAGHTALIRVTLPGVFLPIVQK